jgi:hypothetical protein
VLGAYSERQIIPLVEKETPFQNTKMVLERTKIKPRVPTGLETKNDCAGDDQQQFTGMDWIRPKF